MPCYEPPRKDDYAFEEKYTKLRKHHREVETLFENLLADRVSLKYAKTQYAILKAKWENR